MVRKLRSKIEYLKGIVSSSSFSLNRTITTNTGVYFVTQDSFTTHLKLLFKKHGSDKSTEHDYHLFYGKLLPELPKGSLLEIGIGTNNPILKSTMGQNGKPGASLFAWRELGAFGTVNGADIDKEILFSGERKILTHYVDQTNTKDLEELRLNIKSQKFSLVIDDGLHEVNANITALEALWDIVEPGGYYCIEDIKKVNLVPLIAGLSRYIKSEEWQLYQNYNRKIDNAILCFRKI